MVAGTMMDTAITDITITAIIRVVNIAVRIVVNTARNKALIIAAIDMLNAITATLIAAMATPPHVTAIPQGRDTIAHNTEHATMSAVIITIINAPAMYAITDTMVSMIHRMGTIGFTMMIAATPSSPPSQLAQSSAWSSVPSPMTRQDKS
jgi:hypothetical protein